MKNAECSICSSKEGQVSEYLKSGIFYCSRHSHQMHRHGRILERTIRDKNEIRINGDICEMDLYDMKGNVRATTIFDSRHIDKIKKYKWALTTFGYVRNVSNRIMLHRIILGANPEEIVDHINRTPIDNRDNNLRIVTKSQNGVNKGKQSNNTSGYPGINYDKKNKKWKVRLNMDKKGIWLGRYSSLQEAVSVRKEAEKKYFGEYSPVGLDDERLLAI